MRLQGHSDRDQPDQRVCRNAVSEEAANATINRDLSALKRMLNLGFRQTPPRVERIPYIPMLRENNIRKGFFEHADFLTLRDALPDFMKGFVTFGYKTGWRFSEITNLTWERVDRKGAIVRLEPGETKNQEGRTVFMDPELQEVINKQWENRKRSGKLGPLVFPSRDGEQPDRGLPKPVERRLQEGRHRQTPLP